MTFCPQPKPTKADRLRKKAKDQATASRELTALYATVYKRDGYRCVACHRTVKPGSLEELKRAHPHHIIPRSKADKAVKHTTRNVTTVCPFCHDEIGKKLWISGNADRKLTIRRAA